MEEVSAVRMIIDALLGLGLFLILGFIVYKWIKRTEEKKLPKGVGGGESIYYQSSLIIMLDKDKKPHVIRRNKSEDCPTKEYVLGVPNGKCWGDGHYLCDGCKNFRNDFLFPEGKDLRDRLLQRQGDIRISTFKISKN